MDPMELAAAGTSVLGGLFSGLTGMSAADQQAAAYKLAAKRSEDEAGVNANEALEQGDQTAARSATQAAANGGGLVGSSLGVIQQASSAAMFNARADSYRGLTAADSDLYDAQIAKDNGVNSLLGGLIGSAASGTSDIARFDAKDSLQGLY